MSYAVFHKIKKVWFYPFVKHPRFLYLVHNTNERHHANGQKDVYLSKSTDNANLTEEGMREVVRQGGEALDSMFGRMQAFNANINGSPAYLHPKERSSGSVDGAKRHVFAVVFSLHGQTPLA